MKLNPKKLTLPLTLLLLLLATQQVTARKLKNMFSKALTLHRTDTHSGSRCRPKYKFQ